ncbi:hypothetical protein DdX_04184 [Ditylenchus destructor]|uniref:Uncharacterized protein n=1 Tax=Ditylenchus destructor TaxID=166010 RepID=A0AAD4RAX2_9BILA|nr:hypothetical protein DdX_04184 [Ditylenchus destructor]
MCTRCELLSCFGRYFDDLSCSSAERFLLDDCLGRPILPARRRYEQAVSACDPCHPYGLAVDSSAVSLLLFGAPYREIS